MLILAAVFILVSLPFSVRSEQMTIDKSLKVRRGLVRVRSVMTRAERLEKLKADDRWKEGDDVLGLPKVRVQKLAIKKKVKKKKEEEGDGKAAPAKGGAAPKAAAKKPEGKK